MWVGAGTGAVAVSRPFLTLSHEHCVRLTMKTMLLVIFDAADAVLIHKIHYQLILLKPFPRSL